MLVLNFAHPLTDTQRAQIGQMAGRPIERVLPIVTQFDNSQSFVEQARSLVDGINLTPDEWQTQPMLINPPAYAPVAVTLLAELHGRMGYFPTVIRVRPIPGLTPTQYEVAELINLQHVRDDARRQR